MFPLPITNHQSLVTILNDLTLINGIYELPITNYYELKIGNFKKLRHLDICAVSFYEMKKILNQALKKGPKHITFIMHSFSFIKKRDVQYKTAQPNFIVINRFKKLCEFLSKNKNLFKVITLSQFAQSLPDYALRTKHYKLSTTHYGLRTKHYALWTKDQGLWIKDQGLYSLHRQHPIFTKICNPSYPIFIEFALLKFERSNMLSFHLNNHF